MADCDIRIEFDRRDRTYRGGEIVQGRVVVKTTGAVQCESLRLERYWQTAGEGAVDRGKRVSATLFRGRWEAGQTHVYPFHFTAPAAPLTCKGRLVAVQHFVEASAVVPWAFDPRAKEAFIVAPGGTGGRVETGAISTDWSEVDLIGVLGGPTGMAIGVGLFVLSMFFGPLGPVLFIAGLALLAFAAFMAFAKRKVGDVQVDLPRAVWPGASVPIRLSFRPSGELKVNGITARLVGRERVKRSGGKESGARTSVFYDHVTALHGSSTTESFSRVVVMGELPIPQTDLLSLDAAHNKVEWRLELRIDVPFWPDTVHRRGLRVVPRVMEDEQEEAEAARQAGPIDVVDPATALREAAATAKPTGPPPISAMPKVQPLPAGPGEVAGIGSAAGMGASIGPAVTRKPLWSDEDEAGVEPAKVEFDAAGEVGAMHVPATPEVEPPAPAKPEPLSAAPVANHPLDAPPRPTDPATPTQGADSVAGLIQAMDRIATADRFNGERERLLDELASHPFELTIEPERVEWTISMESAAEYRSGRTVVGRLRGAGRAIAVRFPDSQNARVESAPKGEPMTLTVRIVEWNSLYDRAECEALVV